MAASFTRYLGLAATVLLIILLTAFSHHYSAHRLLTPTLTNNYNTKENIGNSTHPLWADLRSPANETLGFQSIQFINLPHRFDYGDAMSLQSMAAGLKYQEAKGITPDDIKQKGLPPSSSEFGKAQAACFRSHSNVWRKIVDENINTALILESDATFDINIKAIMRRFSAGLNELLKKSPAVLASNDLKATEEDPYVSANWDLLTFAYCAEQPDWHDDEIGYHDPDAPDAGYYEEEEQQERRHVRRSNAPICTTAYGISQSGARKLLLRGAIDYNKPVDLAIADLVMTGQLVAYGTSPVLFSQWEYSDGIGAEQLNSNIDDRPSQDDSALYENWSKVHENRNVWRLNYMYQNSIKHPALEKLNERIFGNIQANPKKELTIKDPSEEEKEKEQK